MVGRKKTYWIWMDYKLPFPCDKDFWRDPRGVRGWEMQLYPSEDGSDMRQINQYVCVLTVELLNKEKPERPNEETGATYMVADGACVDPRLR